MFLECIIGFLWCFGWLLGCSRGFLVTCFRWLGDFKGVGVGLYVVLGGC